MPGKSVAGSSEFVQLLAEANDLQAQAGIVRLILGANGTVNGKGAKAFLIHLAIETFGVDYYSDIVLCAWGLLNEYSTITSVDERREKFLNESGYRGKRNTGKPLTVRGLMSTELILYEKIEKHYENINDKRAFLKAARAKYIVELPEQNDDYVQLPRPSYLTSGPMPMNNLPREETPFLGREGIIEELADKFNQGAKIQQLYGMGGVGKSSIALHYAYQYASRYTSIAWIEQKDDRPLNTSCLEFLKKVLPDKTFTDAATVMAAFTSYFINTTNWLIIYDNVDLLDEDAEREKQIRDELEQYIPSGRGHILLTTRYSRGYNADNKIAVDVFDPELALELLVSRSNQPADDYAKQLVERVGCLPLALTYIGAYIREQHITYEEYLKLWDQNGMELFDQERGDYAKTTVRQAFYISLKKLAVENPSDDTLALKELLEICARLDIDRIPLRDYIAYMSIRIAEQTEAKQRMLEEGADSPYYMRDPDGVYRPYRLIEIRPDGTEILERLSGDHGEISTIKPAPLTVALQDALKRNELIGRAAAYSLVSWDGKYLSMHPLLREVIRDEFLHDEPDISMFRDFMLNGIYEHNGKNKQAKEHKIAALKKQLESLEMTLKLGLDFSPPEDDDALQSEIKRIKDELESLK